MAQLRPREGRAVRQYPQGQGTRNFPQLAALRGPADPAGGRWQVWNQPRARTTDRGAAQAAAQAIPQVTSFRHRAGGAVDARSVGTSRLPGRGADAIMAIAGAGSTGGQALCESERAP